METYRLHGRIGFKVTRLARIMEARLEKGLSRHGITRLMWCVLSGIGLEDVKTPSTLAEHIGIARPAISRLLKTMEEKGLVARTSPDDDKRYTELALTALGLEKLKTCHVLVHDLNNHFAGKIDQGLYENFLETIDALTEGEKVQLMRL
ncbi:MAG: MarR family transcriptional regulator [Roseibium sp.]|uniref:MarR family winged helix-turn-helix transcriptional regulator n=1 Tax=Roseibium sp. TaxID=1936156 RepID=UPI003D9C3116